MAREPKHAYSKSGGGYCKVCATAVGEPVKTQPTLVDDETFCPRCFSWHRCLLEPERFNARYIAPVRCQFCAWVSVCFSAGPGMMRMCGHCGKPGALLLPMNHEQTVEFEKMIRDAIDAAKTMNVTGPGS